jgi:hypothetical protein
MINAFELYNSDVDEFDMDQLKTENEIIEEGMQLFGKYFRALWW